MRYGYLNCDIISHFMLRFELIIKSNHLSNRETPTLEENLSNNWNMLAYPSKMGIDYLSLLSLIGLIKLTNSEKIFMY